MYEVYLNNELFQSLNIKQILGDKVDIKYFNNFGDAWFILGEQFIPSYKNVIVQDDARKLYSSIYNNEDIKKYGVIAISYKNK
jgi:hypothetical protein